MSDHPKNLCVGRLWAIENLAPFIAALPAWQRGAAHQELLPFGPQRTLDDEFAVGPKRAAPTPPIPTSIALKFSRLNDATSEAEIRLALYEVYSFPEPGRQSHLPDRQPSLFDETGKLGESLPERPKQVLPAGSVVTSLEALIHAERKYPTIYADPPWAYANVASRAAAKNH